MKRISTLNYCCGIEPADSLSLVVKSAEVARQRVPPPYDVQSTVRCRSTRALDLFAFSGSVAGPSGESVPGNA